MSSRSASKFTVLQPSVQLDDPHIWSDAKNRLSLRFSIYECLVRYDNCGGYLPALAESWRVEDDARTWTFNLRTDVLYHDGSRLHAQDIVATLERVCDPELEGEFGTKGLYHTYLVGTAVDAIDAQTVRLVTAEPMADLLDLLVKLPIAPRHALDEIALKPIGSGPFRFTNGDDGHVEMERFAQYWAGPPLLEKVVWIAQPQVGQRVAALLTGEADIITDVGLEEKRMIDAAEQARVVALESSMCIILICNIQQGACVDKRVRQALNYAIDVPAIINSVKGGTARPLNGPLTPLHLGHDPATKPYPYDPDKARALLAAAGYAGGLEIIIDIPTSHPDEAPLLVQHIAAQYAEIGVKAVVKSFADRPGYAQMVKAKQIDDACCFDSSPLSTYRSLREKFHSGIAGPWWQGYHNPNVNNLLEQAWGTVDDEQRQRLYRRAFRIIRDDAAWVFLYNPSYFWGVRSRAQGWKAGIDGLIRFS